MAGSRLLLKFPLHQSAGASLAHLPVNKKQAVNSEIVINKCDECLNVEICLDYKNEGENGQSKSDFLIK